MSFIVGATDVGKILGDMGYDQPEPEPPVSPNVGMELGFAVRESTDTTTNTQASAAAANKINGLAVTVMGIGRPVKVEFYDLVRHSVANNGVGALFLVNGALVLDQTQIGQSSTPIVSQSRSLYVMHRFVIPDGVEWTFEIGKWISGSGTGTYEGSESAPMTLTVTQQ